MFKRPQHSQAELCVEVSVQAILFLLRIPAKNLPKMEGLRIKLERRYNNKNATSRGKVDALN